MSSQLSTMLVTLAQRARPVLVRGFASSSRIASEVADAEKPKAKVKKAVKGWFKLSKLTAVTSALQAGTVMTGLGVFKDKPDPIALPEEQYPPWLWTLLDEQKPKQLEKGERDFKAERKTLRNANRINIKAANFLKTT